MLTIQMTDDDWNSVQSLNTTAASCLCRFAQQMLQRRNSSIVIITSTSEFVQIVGKQTMLRGSRPWGNDQIVGQRNGKRGTGVTVSHQGLLPRT